MNYNFERYYDAPNKPVVFNFENNKNREPRGFTFLDFREDKELGYMYHLVSDSTCSPVVGLRNEHINVNDAFIRGHVDKIRNMTIINDIITPIGGKLEEFSLLQFKGGSETYRNRYQLVHELKDNDEKHVGYIAYDRVDSELKFVSAFILYIMQLTGERTTGVEVYTTPTGIIKIKSKADISIARCSKSIFDKFSIKLKCKKIHYQNSSNETAPSADYEVTGGIWDRHKLITPELIKNGVTNVVQLDELNIRIYEFSEESKQNKGDIPIIVTDTSNIENIAVKNKKKHPRFIVISRY